MRRIPTLLCMLALIGAATPAWATVTSTSVTLSWTLATDPDNAQSTLRYEVCQASTNTIATVAGCEAASLVQAFTANIATATVGGLTPATTYFFNVVVADPFNNKAAYVPLQVTTLPDTTPPVPGNNGIITAENITGSSVTFTWSPASDPDDDPATLRYEVCQSSVKKLSSVNGCERALIQMVAANVTTFTATGLQPATRYHFNVVAEDPAGNKVAYVPLTQKTPRLGPGGVNPA